MPSEDLDFGAAHVVIAHQTRELIGGRFTWKSVLSVKLDFDESTVLAGLPLAVHAVN